MAIAQPISSASSPVRTAPPRTEPTPAPRGGPYVEDDENFWEEPKLTTRKSADSSYPGLGDGGARGAATGPMGYGGFAKALGAQGTSSRPGDFPGLPSAPRMAVPQDRSDLGTTVTIPRPSARKGGNGAAPPPAPSGIIERVDGRSEFQRWLMGSITAITGSNDTTLFDFCMTLDNSDEVAEYIRAYLGETAQVNAFIKDFLKRRPAALSQQQEKEQQQPLQQQPGASSSADVQSDGSDDGWTAIGAQPGGGKKKKNKKKAKSGVDPSLLGFGDY